MEVQIGQIANAINSRSQGNLPSKTEVNPKEQCKAVILRSGKTLDDVNVQSKTSELVSENAKNEIEKQLEDSKDDYYKPVPLKPYVSPIPFPQRLIQNKVDN